MIGIIGGTGPEGRGLALRFALAGRQVALGSRVPARAEAAAARVNAKAPGAAALAGSNDDAARLADTAFLTFPYEAQRLLLPSLREALSGKTVITTIAPMRFDRNGAAYVEPEEGSAAMQAQLLLPDSRVVAAFQTVSAHDLLNAPHPVDSDVIVCSDHDADKRAALALADAVPGARGVDGGGLRNAALVERITPLLITINRIHNARSAIRITGV